MTRENFTRWTCNVCGAMEETGGGKQPKGWVGYAMTEPGTPAADPRPLGHLCPEDAAKVAEAVKDRR